MTKWNTTDWGIFICIVIAILCIGAMIYMAATTKLPTMVYEVKAEIKDNRVYTECPSCKRKLLLTGVKNSDDKTTDL